MRDSIKYSNNVLLIITQGYSFMKLQSLLEQKNFANKPAILANQTFKYIIDFKIVNKLQKLNISKNMKSLPCLHWSI